MAQDETVTCTFNNVRQTGKLEVKKSLSPTTDPGKFDLQIDGTTDANADDVGHNGSTGEETLNTGNHTVGEVAGASTDLANYQKSIECRDDNGTGAVVASAGVDNAGPLTVNVTSGSDIVCVITNTRETGKLEVKKSLSPTTDPGLFNLQIDGTTDANATTSATTARRARRPLNTGTHTVGETAGTSTDLANYQKSIECKADNGTGAVVASVAGGQRRPAECHVTTGSDIVCVITNTRETGKLEVKKTLSPTTDPGTVQPPDRRYDRRRRRRRRRRRLDRRGDPQHRQPHRRRDRRARARTWPTTRSRSSARPTTAPAPWSPARPATTPAR